jgi:hypothetical protein
MFGILTNIYAVIIEVNINEEITHGKQVSINTCILCDGKSVAFGYLFLFDFQL